MLGKEKTKLDIKLSLNEIENKLNKMLVYISDKYETLKRSLEYDNSCLLQIIKRQQETIDTLVNDKFVKSEAFECVVFIPYRGKPVVIRDGVKIDLDKVTSFDLNWYHDNNLELTVRSE